MRQVASSEWCRAQMNELRRRADNAKSVLFSTLELKAEYEQTLQVYMAYIVLSFVHFYVVLSYIMLCSIL